MIGSGENSLRPSCSLWALWKALVSHKTHKGHKEHKEAVAVLNIKLQAIEYFIKSGSVDFCSRIQMKSAIKAVKFTQRAK